MTGYGWLSKFVTVAILAGFSSVILVMLLGQSRVFYSMSQRRAGAEGVLRGAPALPDAVEVEHAVLRASPALFAAFIPGDIVGEMTSIGTLFAFILVCAGVWIMRVRRPDIPRGFTVPALPVVATLGIVVCGAMIYGLGWTNWLRLIVWLVIGLVFYFGYARRHSRLGVDSFVETYDRTVLDGQALATRMQEEIKPRGRGVRERSTAARPGSASCSSATIRRRKFTFETR